MKTILIAFLTICISNILFSQPKAISEWTIIPSNLINGKLIDQKGNNDADIKGEIFSLNQNSYEVIKLNGIENMFVISDNIKEAELPSQSFTVYAMLYSQSLSNYSGIISAFQDNGDYEKGWVFTLVNDKIALGLSTKGSDDGNGRMTYLYSQSPLILNTWNFVAATYDGNRMKIYLNGQIVGESTEQNGEINYPEEAAFVIGSYYDKNEDFKFHGSLYKLGIFEGALTDKELQSLYQSHESEMSKLPDLVDQSIFIVKPYLQHIALNSTNVKFETKVPTKIKLQYGEEIPLENEIEIKEFKEFHTVKINELKEAETYFYKVIVENEKNEKYSSDLSTLQTAVGKNKPITFGIISDTQNNPEVIKIVSEKIFEERPNFVVHAGDIVGNGHKKHEWTNEFLNSAHTLMSRVSIFAALGNHDEDAEYYYRYMSNGNDDYCYTFNYAETQFIIIDSNRDLKENSDQYKKVELLLKDSNSKWKIAVFHHPPYSSDENDYGDTWKGKSVLGDRDLDDLVKLLEKYKVDLVINGHIHSYERTFPIHKNQIDEENGITYLVMGGAGGGLEQASPTRPWFSSKVKSCHHYGIAQIFNNKFQLKVYDLNGNLIDIYEQNK